MEILMIIGDIFGIVGGLFSFFVWIFLWRQKQLVKIRIITPFKDTRVFHIPFRSVSRAEVLGCAGIVTQPLSFQTCHASLQTQLEAVWKGSRVITLKVGYKD